MADNSNQDDKDLLKIDSDIDQHRTIAIFIVMFVASAYILFWFNGIELNNALDSWGTFGDFIGGILNPIFACFAFYWLTYSVRLQIKELKDTRSELAKASAAQERSAEHQESIAILEKTNVDTQKEILELQKQSLRSQIEANAAQQQQIAIQNFESLFFELLKAKTDVTDNIVYHHEDLSGNFHANPPRSIIKTFTGKKAIEQYIIDFKSRVKEDWGHHYTNNLLSQSGSYFRLNYQIVKLIHSNEFFQTLDKVKGKNYSKKQKEYFDIFRATFNQYELEAIFFNCLSSYGNEKFKKLIENYGLFEPLILENELYGYTNFHKLTEYAYQYNPCIFEKDKKWENYFKQIDILKKINLAKIQNELIILYTNGYIEPVKNSYLLAADEFKKNPSIMLAIVWDLKRISPEWNLDSMLKIQKEAYQDKINNNNKNIKKIISNELENAQISDLVFLKNIISDTKETTYLINELKHLTYIEEIKIIIFYRINLSEFIKKFSVSHN